MAPAPATIHILRRIGVVVLATILAGTGLLMVAHLACAHDRTGEGSHQDCKICKKFSHNSAVPVFTSNAQSAGPPIILAAEPGPTADSVVFLRPRGRAPPTTYSVSKTYSPWVN